MDVTRLSSKGQVIIPKLVRQSHHWEAGQELVVIDTDDGVLLKPKKSFQQTGIDDVSGCLSSTQQSPKTEADFKDAIKRGVKERFHDRS